MVGLAPEFLDLTLHASELSLLFGDLGLEDILRLKPCPLTDGAEILLHLLLDRQLDLALCVVELTLLSQHIGLGLLGFGELRIVRGERLLQIRKLLVALTKIVSERKTRLPCLGLCDGSALGPQLGRDLFVDGFARLDQPVLRLLEAGLTTTKIGLLGRELRLEVLAALRDDPAPPAIRSA